MSAKSPERNRHQVGIFLCAVRAYPSCSTKSVFAMVACIMLVGCTPSPVSKETHIKQVQGAIAKAGGETNILNESRTLFARLSHETNFVLCSVKDDRYFEGLSAMTNLGDVLRYEPYEPDRVSIRIHNSHFDTYFITLVNPDFPQPPGFERIGGNVGFIEQDGATN